MILKFPLKAQGRCDVIYGIKFLNLTSGEISASYMFLIACLLKVDTQ